MMHPRHVFVDLPKDRRTEVYCFGLAAKEAKRGAFHLLGKSKLCSRKNAHRRCGILRCGKPSCTGPEVDCRKLVTDLSRSGFDVVQTIVAHGSGSCTTWSADVGRGALWLNQVFSALGNAPLALDTAGRSDGYEMTSPQS